MANVALASAGATLTGTNSGGGVGTPGDITWANNGLPRYDGAAFDIWFCATPNNLVVNFSGTPLIDTVKLWFGDGDGRASDPGPTDTGTNGLQPANFTIDTWNGSSWVNQATITGNTFLTRTITFASVSTTKLRFAWTTDLGGTAVYLNEIEVYESTAGTGSAAGTSTAIAAGESSTGAGSAAGTSTAVAIATGLGIGTAAGTSTAVAVGVTAVVGAGFSAGTSIAIASPITVVRKNWLRAPYASATVMVFEVQDTSLYTYLFGVSAPIVSDIPVLYDGNKNGTPFIKNINPNFLCVRFGATRLVDTISVWSSAVDDPSDQMAYPTFTLAQNGLVGSADEILQIFDDTGTLIASATVTANRATKLTITFSQRSLKGFFIGGSGTPHYSIQQIKTGTVIEEIEAYQTYTSYDATLIATANIVANTELHHVVFASSTANATSSVLIREVQTEVSTANIRSFVSSQTDTTQTVVSTANATSSADGDISFVLVSTANVTSTVLNTPTVATYISTANITSSVQLAVTRGVTLVSTANATSHIEESRLSFTLVSTANIVSTVVGTKVVTEVVVSTADITSNVGASTHYTEITLVSTANATSSVSGQVDSHAVYVSTADIRSYVILPGLPGGLLAIWCNPITHAAASWSGTPFESVIEVDGVMYGAGVGGIYKMEDAAEENVTIDSYVTWDLLDFGDPRKHRPGDFMIDGTAASPLKVTVTNEQGSWDYPTHLPKNTMTTNFRAQLGKGLNSRHLRFTVANTKSKEFWFDTAEIEVIQLSRHIGGRHG